METSTPLNYDIVVVGAGMGGLAACIFLAKAGRRVICIDPEPFPRSRVGESLDWSTPHLLQSLGLSPNLLVEEQIATYKRKIKVVPQDGPTFTAGPADWMNRKPLNLGIVTLHVNRCEFDLRLFEMAQNLGVTFLWDRVSAIETEGDRVVGCRTAGHQQITAPWFIDASGGARLLATSFKIPKIQFGRSKVGLWTHFNLSAATQGTTLYAAGNNDDEYLSWIWEIPITAHQTSVGFISSADQIKKRRRNGESIKQILTDELARFSRFSPLVGEQKELRVFTCSFRGYVGERACGSNWFIVGEAASMPDPLTSNGVTAALRHAQEAANLILSSSGQASLSEQQRNVYNSNVCRMGNAFNQNIEAALYDWPLRRGLGARAAVKVYSFFGLITNFLYTKYRPQSRFRLTFFWLWFLGMRLWIISWVSVGKLAFRARRPRSSYLPSDAISGER